MKQTKNYIIHNAIVKKSVTRAVYKALLIMLWNVKVNNWGISTKAIKREFHNDQVIMETEISPHFASNCRISKIDQDGWFI